MEEGGVLSLLKKQIKRLKTIKSREMYFGVGKDGLD